MSKLLLITIVVLILAILYIVYTFYYRYRTQRLYIELRNKIKNLALYKKIYGQNCSISLPIYYINMDKHTDRREYMEKQLSQISSNFHRIRGFNGYAIQNTQNDTVDCVTFHNHYVTLSKPEIGCTISHLMAIQTAYENKDELAVICEDDLLLEMCVLSTTPLEQMISEAPSNWDILQLMVGHNHLRKIYKNLSKDKLIYIKRKYPNDIFWSTACYVINRRGMCKILDITQKSYNNFQIIPTDKIYIPRGTADTYIYDLVTTYTVLPCPFIVDNSKMNSSIHTDHTPNHLQNALIILSLYNELSSKQLTFARTLFDMDDILTKYNQIYFLASGTLLGAIRENKFIEHDTDIDLGIFVQDYDPNIETEILKTFKLKHRLGNIQTGYEISFIHPDTNINIDIFLYYPEGDYLWCPSFFNICDRAKNKICRWKNSVFGLKTIQFLSRNFNIPDDPERYLEESYGKEWRVPKKFIYKEGLENGYNNLIRSDFNREGML